VTDLTHALLLFPAGRAVAGLPLPPADGPVEVRRVSALPDPGALSAERPTVVFLDADLLGGTAPDQVSALATVAALVGVGAPGETEPTPAFAAAPLTGWLAADAPAGVGATALRGALRHAATIVAAARAERLERTNARELLDLSSVGTALATQRDLDALLGMIVSQAIRLTSADAASLYLIQHDESGTPTSLQFTLSQNLTFPDLPLIQFDIPLDHSSVAGYVASTGETLQIDDVYDLAPDLPYQLNRSFDERFGYRTKSMLVIPMRSHRQEVTGVLQLINRKREADVRLSNVETAEAQILPFEARAVTLATALAAQAAVAIENNTLYENIENLLDGFVTAAVSAIEARDPATSGHSLRVANFTLALAEAVDRTGDGPYAPQTFTRDQMREMRYAGLLHDFGKVGVREKVLVKQKKLYGHDLVNLRQRFQYLMQQADLEFERHRAEYLLANGASAYAEALRRLESARSARHQQLQHWLDVVVRANEPTILPEGVTEELETIGQETWTDRDGTEHPVLTEAEVRFLGITRGNLDVRERREIESHVSHTFRFLQMIPWTRELGNVAHIAHGHHEKLDGSGYPRGVTAEEIPVQTRMMTIADIYDALTAADRPYKRAVTAERAIDILRSEVSRGLLDGDLLGIFVDAGVFSMVLDTEPTRRRSTGRSRPSLIT
jgi:HD-GYP domain-containing protein (c-di-GMP phosphodiesterase class II)